MGRDSKVDITLQVTSPTMDSTRGEGVGLDSALGAIDNFNNNSELWDSYDLRYISEIVVFEPFVITSYISKIYRRS